MSELNVCCFVEKWASGGIESFLFNVICNLDSRCHVDIVASVLEESVFTSILQRKGVVFYQLSGKANEVFTNGNLFSKHLRSHKYDVLHVNAYQSLSLRMLKIGKRYNIPVRIAHSHNTEIRHTSTKVFKKCLNQIGKRLYSKYATTYCACSNAAASFLFPKEIIQKSKYTFIPNGIDRTRFLFNENSRKRVRKELKIEDKYVIGCIGRLCSQKNQSMLIDVFGKVSTMLPNAFLLLIGDGEDKQRLLDKISRNGFNESVLLYGNTDSPEDLLSAMDVFALPSLFEGLPISAVEAQVSGLPCLLSDKITKDCSFSNETHFLPISDHIKWINEIKRLHEIKIDRTSVKGDTFDIKNVVLIIERLYGLLKQ